MLIEGSIKSNKTQLLIDKYVGLIDSGISSNEILVICLNSFKRQSFIEKVKKQVKSESLENFNIYTFYGLCYNSVLDNWPSIEDQINLGKIKIIPNLCGLETSQYMLKQSIREEGFKDYTSKLNLLHQLFRRNSLITQNKLSDKEVLNRSKVLKESFAQDAQNALKFFKKLTLEARSFDYLRQLAIFPLIYEKTDYFKDIKYLIVDDADEITYIIWDFINHLKPQLKDIFIAYDKQGASRCGYLSAYRTSVFQFEELFNQKADILKNNDKISSLVEVFYQNIKGNSKTLLKNIELIESDKRLDMVDSTIEKIKQLKESGEKTNEISIISPVFDEAMRFSLSEAFDFSGINYQFISGSEKLVENNFVKNSLTLLKLANKSWGIKVEELEIRGLLLNLAKIPIKYCRKVIQKYNNTNELLEVDFDNDELNKRYDSLLTLIKILQEKLMPLSKQLFLIYKNYCNTLEKTDLEKFTFLIKEVEDFEKAFSTHNETYKKEFIIQLENTVISENPSNPTEINDDCIIISTPQKIIDLEIKTKHQIWLDISNNEWLKQDIGPLYNSWVFNAEWDKNEFTYEDNIRLTREKTARVIRKLMLCCNEQIHMHSSLYDSNGNENFGGLLDFIETSSEEKPKAKKITPRKDQELVLNYKSGKMGVMAVPGAGKTTILLALIIKLLESGVKGENIFVLTYMDSAAKNLKERIKNLYTRNTELPNISTIHGLALRIIKENSNYAKLNLSENFEIADDNERQKIIRETLSKLNIEQDKYENYEKSISTIKLSANEFELKSKYKDINDFIRFFNEYNNLLRRNNLIDYDDMLNLSVRLLEKNPEILDYYQGLCHFMIEDEAQDSSPLQQKLLSLLSAKYNNLLRCGDINQSITSTFTNADLKDFKKFIEDNQKVEMSSSQRCAKSIYELANKLISYTQNTPELKNSFYKIDMTPTGANPTSVEKPSYKTFEKETDEKLFILKQIKKIMTESPKKTISILVRNNYQVNDFNSYLSANGLKTITRTDCLGEKSVFQIILSIFKTIQQPWNNKLILNLLENFAKNKIINISQEQTEFIKNLKRPFINLPLETIEENNLEQFFWDIEYWLNNSSLALNELATKIGLYHFKTTVEKSNIYLISTLIKRLMASYKQTQTIIEKLEDISKRPNLSGYKFFSEEENKKDIEGQISIMTVHKAKGDEFDIVFVPQLNEENYSSSTQTTKIKSNTNFMETIKALNPNYKRKIPEELKASLVEENFRLLYVAITRAKEQLFLSCSEKNSRQKKLTPSILFNELLGGNDE